MRAQATGQISEKLDFAVPALAWPALLTGARLKQLFSIPVLAPNALHSLNVSLC